MSEPPAGGGEEGERERERGEGGGGRKERGRRRRREEEGERDGERGRRRKRGEEEEEGTLELSEDPQILAATAPSSTTNHCYVKRLCSNEANLKSEVKGSLSR